MELKAFRRVTLLLVSVCILGIYFLYPHPLKTEVKVHQYLSNHYKYVTPSQLSLDKHYSSKMRDIVWYNIPSWIRTRNMRINFSLCEYKNCRMLEDRKKTLESSAIVFSLADRGLGQTPPLSNGKRNPDQVWIFFSQESPALFYRPMSKQWISAFNWSWSYRTDADVFFSYGLLKKRPQLPVKNYSAIFKSKTRFAAWFVSRCNVDSKRMKYVKLLKRYVPIDVYGRCGNSLSNETNPSAMLSRDYKFYLSFENSICQDYVTEKFFKYSSLDLIPVVRGGADYDKQFPNKTFINTAHFSSVKKLAKFLLKVGSSEEEYTEYLRSKDQYGYLSGPNEYMYQISVCTLCEKLNNLEKYRKVYPDYRKWAGTCMKPDDIIAE